MKKLNYLFGAAAMAFAMVLASCSATDLPVDPNEPKIHNGDDLAAVIANGENLEIVNGVPTLNLPAGVSLTMNEEIVMDMHINITGDESNPATIKIGETGKFITKSGVNFKNVIIDAADLTAPLVTLGVDQPDEWSFSSLSFINVDVIGLKKALTYAACKNYDVVSYIDNCRIQVAGDVTVFDYTKGSVATVFDILKSTIWAPEATTKSLYSSQGGQKATEFFGSDSQLTQQFLFENSTFYNLTKSKNFFSHRQSNQTWLQYDVKDCIFVNCGKKGQTIKGLNGGQSGKNPVWNITGNVFNFEDADTSADEATGDDDEPVKDSKAVVVKFVDAANGDFSQKDAAAGDPRWIPVM